MEVEVPEAPPEEGRSTFQSVLRERQSREARRAQGDELCYKIGTAITGAFHRAIAYNALERLYERVVGKRADDLSGSSRRSGKSSMDLPDDNEAEEDDYGQRRAAPEVPKEVSRKYTGGALRVAALVSEFSNQEAKAVVQDEIRRGGTTASELSAQSVRRGMVAILRAQFNLQCKTEIPEDRKRRVLPYPEITKEEG